MAREAQKVTTDGVWYAPDIDGNRDDPDPFEVFIHPMTAGDMKRVERGMGEYTAGKINFAERGQKQVREIISKCVTDARGYSIWNTKTGEKITPRNGAALYAAIMDHGDDKEASILDDVFQAIKDASHLKAGLRETLRLRFGSPVPVTQSHGAGAASAVVERTHPGQTQTTQHGGIVGTVMMSPTPQPDGAGIIHFGGAHGQ